MLTSIDNGAYTVNSYIAGLHPIGGLEGQNIVDIDDTATHFLTAEGNVFYDDSNYNQKRTAQIPISELGGHPIIKIIQTYEYLRKSPLYLINDRNQLLVRNDSTTSKPIQLKNTSRVVNMFKSESGAVFTVHSLFLHKR
jgi:hypothetical protein